MVRCPQCSQHFTAEEPEPFTVHQVPAGSPALKTGLIAFGAVGTLALLLSAVVIAVLSIRTEAPRPAPAEVNQRATDDRLAALQRRLEEQQQEASRDRRRAREQQDETERERRRLQQTVSDLETRARSAEQKPVAPASASPAAAEPKTVAEDAAKKVRADYEARLDAGRAAMVAQRYADALREYTAALTLVPGDAAALRGQADAQNRLEGQQDRQKRQANATTLVEKAKAAYRAKRYDEALSDANQALRENPDDPDARQLQRDAAQAKRAARTDTSQLMSLADSALAQGRYEEASRLYDRVLQQSPDDEAAQRGKRSADQAAQDTQASLTGYYRFMALGTLSMQNLQYADAARLFAEALRQVPGDLAAARGLSDAQNAVAGVVIGQANFYRALQNGYAALQAQRPADATTAFQAALRLSPDNPLAVVGLRQARAMKKQAASGNSAVPSATGSNR
jgi:tetratricopeptide (TPR) repeat protein